jgi:hypothetical protein
MHIKSFFVLMSLLLLISQSFSAFAVSVFQWEDSNGVTHFSEQTPSEGMVVHHLSHYELDENYPQGKEPAEDYFSVVNQWKRVNDERESRIKLKQANRQSRTFVPQKQIQAPSIEQPPQRYYSRLLPHPYSYNHGQGFHQGFHVSQPGNQTMDPVPTTPRAYAGKVAVSK